MKRPGTRGGYEKLLARIRERIPGVTLRTTFIVGFPGETEQDFEELLTFIEAVRFDHVGVFTYSHEEGTSAYGLVDDVPAAVKKKRQSRLMARQKQIVARQQKGRIGERTRLLVDGPSPQHELVLRGRLEGQAPDVDPQVYLTDADPETLAPAPFWTSRSSARMGTTWWRGPCRSHVLRGGLRKAASRRTAAASPRMLIPAPVFTPGLARPSASVSEPPSGAAGRRRAWPAACYYVESGRSLGNQSGPFAHFLCLRGRLDPARAHS
jgi:hypothetical protein